MRAFVLLLLVASAAELPERFATNSHAANTRGVTAYERKEYAKAAAAFAQRHAIRPTAGSAFNLGTAEIAAGKREEGSATLARAMRDPSLRASSLYNRGTSALASSAFDHAIRDYTEALRLRPGDAKAKRNLEIALVRKQQMEMQSQRQQKQRKGGNDDKERAKPSSPSDGEPRRNAGRPDPEALLRSVQQQEREELQRMKRQRAAGPRVGW